LNIMFLSFTNVGESFLHFIFSEFCKPDDSTS
jgi:hypothetical protein